MEKVNQKMKRGLRGVLIGLRATYGSSPQRQDVGVEETLRSEHFQVAKTVRHGFPCKPSVVAYDPVQNLLAIGTKTGALRIFGRPGVEVHVQHEGNSAIQQLMFLVNEGALLSVNADDQIHMWTLRQKRPEIVHSLKFQRERISFCHLPFQSKWLYVGTERGNVYVVNMESFTLSGYIINWNKAIELVRSSHPGPIVHISDNPVDANRLLIGYESGCVVLWDLKNKVAECRYSCTETLKSACWHHEGKQFICSHGDGSLTIWNYKTPQQPQSYMMPHAKLGKDGKPESCRPILKIDYRTVRNGEPYIIFSGGTPADRQNQTPSLTVMKGNNMTVLEMEHEIVDFVTLSTTPWNSDVQDPHSIAVLLQNDLVVVDLTSQGYPCYENPYAMDIHESPVTACLYVADCPQELIQAYYSVGCKNKNKTGYSEKEWPVDGGGWGSTTCNILEIIVTGHADGSIKFWDASSVTLRALYKLKTSKVFDESRCRQRRPGENDVTAGSSVASLALFEDLFAIQQMYLCVDSRLLCVAGASHVVVFNFSKLEMSIDCPVLEVSIMYEISDGLETPEFEFPVVPPPKQSFSSLSQHGSTAAATATATTTTTANGRENKTSVRVRSGQRKWPTGYQPSLCCIVTWMDGEPPPPITSLSINSRFGLLAFGNECGIAIIDIVQRTCLLSMGTPDLYGSMDPYSRAPRSPKFRQPTTRSGGGSLEATSMAGGGCSNLIIDDCKSPSVEQLHHARSLCLNPSRASRYRQAFSSSGSGSSTSVTSSLSPSTPSELKSHQLRRSRSQCTSRMMRTLTSVASIDDSSPTSGFQVPQSPGGGATAVSSSSTTASATNRYVAAGSGSASSSSIYNDRGDSSFSRSHSSSTTSLENVNKEPIECLVFAEAYTHKADTYTGPCLWVGTSLGTVLVISLTLSLEADVRRREPVIVSPSGTIFRLKGSILAISFLDFNGILIPTATEQWKDTSAKEERKPYNRQQSTLNLKPRVSPTSSVESVGDRQFAIICSEKQARVIALPSQTCAYKVKITETSVVAKAEVITIKDSVCLAVFVANGHIMTFSLPSLRPLMDNDYYPFPDIRIARTICFSNNGHAIHMCSPTEIQKLTMSAEECENIKDMIGELYLPCSMPEAPKPNFFKNLFAGAMATTVVDREELFGESSGKASKGFTKYTPGIGGMPQAQEGAMSAVSEISRAKMLALERGEKLSELEERTERMKLEAEAFSSSSHQLKMKYKDKKWYQF